MLGSLWNALNGGGATVETTISNPKVAPGEILSGTIQISGGDVAKINSLHIALTSHVKVEVDGMDEKMWGTMNLVEDQLPVRSSSISFSVQVPVHAPLSIGRQTHTELYTRLDVSRAIDPKDADSIQIIPDQVQNAVLQAMKNQPDAGGLGCTLKEVESEYGRRTGFRREFDYRPPYGSWSIEEIEIAFLEHTGSGWRVGVTVDSHGSFFTSGREHSASTVITYQEALRGTHYVANELRQLIDRLTR